MKSLFVSLYSIFIVTAIITHIWTVVIAFTQGGLLGGVVTLILQVLGEIYWMIKMFGVNDAYSYIALIHLILAIPFSILGRG